MDQEQINQFINIFKKHQSVKLAYVFGSQVSGKIGPLSDFDFAVYIDENNPKAQFSIKAKLQDELSLVLSSDMVDVVVLNSVKGSDLKYNILTKGKLIYDQEPYRLLVEPRILNEYFDYKLSLTKAGLAV